jgi:hypothetical protein
MSHTLSALRRGLDIHPWGDNELMVILIRKVEARKSLQFVANTLSLLLPLLPIVTLAHQERIWQSMSNWRTLCQLSKFGHRRQANCSYHPSKLPRLRPQCRQYSSVHASELSFGQPLHETHPHLLKAGERRVLKSPSMKSLHS